MSFFEWFENKILVWLFPEEMAKNARIAEHLKACRILLDEIDSITERIDRMR